MEQATCRALSIVSCVCVTGKWNRMHDVCTTGTTTLSIAIARTTAKFYTADLA